jgi:hypothetical protein
MRVNRGGAVHPFVRCRRSLNLSSAVVGGMAGVIPDTIGNLTSLTYVCVGTLSDVTGQL